MLGYQVPSATCSTAAGVDSGCVLPEAYAIKAIVIKINNMKIQNTIGYKGEYLSAVGKCVHVYATPLPKLLVAVFRDLSAVLQLTQHTLQCPASASTPGLR